MAEPKWAALCAGSDVPESVTPLFYRDQADPQDLSAQVVTELAVYGFLYSFVVWEDETQIVDGCLRGQRKQNVDARVYEYFKAARGNSRKHACIATPLVTWENWTSAV